MELISPRNPFCLVSDVWRCKSGPICWFCVCKRETEAAGKARTCISGESVYSWPQQRASAAINLSTLSKLHMNKIKSWLSPCSSDLISHVLATMFEVNALSFLSYARCICTHLYIFRLNLTSLTCFKLQSLWVRWRSCVCSYCHSIMSQPAESTALHSSYCVQHTSLWWRAAEVLETGCFYRVICLITHTSRGSSL